MSSLSRTEYRREEQRRVTESPFKETKWDRHLDTLLTDLNDSVGSSGGSQQRAVLPAAQVTESHGVPGSGDFHERREFVSPDQRTRVVQERYEHTNRGDHGAKPSASYAYESKPSAQYLSSHTTSTKHSAAPPSLPPHSARSAGPQYHAMVTEHHSGPSATTPQHHTLPADHKTESHYQTVKTVSRIVPPQQRVIEYIEEIPPSEVRRTQYRTLRPESRDKSPAAIQYYETRPGVEKRTTKTVTEYLTQSAEPAPASSPAPISPHYFTKSHAEYVDSPPAGTQIIDGKPTTIRYVDKKPITIYHDSKSEYPPASDLPPMPVPEKPPTVYYERVIERQPIIHYYGSPPPEVTPKHSTLPLSSHSTGTQHQTFTLPPPAPAARPAADTSSTVPGRICVSNRYETNNETNRWPGPASRRPSDDYTSRTTYDYVPWRRGQMVRSPDTLRSEPDHGRSSGTDLMDDLRSEPDYARGYDPEPFSRGRAGSLRSDTGYGGRGGDPEPWPRRYGSMRATSQGRRSPPYAEVYRTGAELSGYGYSRPYQPPTAAQTSSFARALSPIQPSGRSEATRPLTNYHRHVTANQAVTKQVYKSYSTDPAPTQTQVPLTQPPQADGSRFKQNILELDSLLDDLDHARKKPGSNGVDPGLAVRDGPSGTSTPYRQSNVQKTVTTTKYTSGGGGPAEPLQQLTPGDHLTALGLTGPRHSPSPNPLDGLDRSLVPELSEPPQSGTTRVTKYEYRSSNRRDVSPQPQIQPAPPPESSTVVDRREYTSTTNTLDRPPPPTDLTDKTVVYNVYNTSDTTLPPPGAPPAGVPTPVVPPTQPGSNTTINYHIYNYGTLGPDGQPVGMPPGGSAPPSESGAPPRGGTLPRQEHTTTTTTYRERYGEQSPPPQQHPRSPDPGPDTTVSNSYVYEKHSRGPTPQRQQPPPPQQQQPSQQPPHTSYTTNTITKHYTIGPDGTEIPVQPGTAPDDKQYPRFPVEEPTPPGGRHTRTTTTTIERTHTHGSPFPTRSPSPSPRRPYRDDGPRVPFPGSPRHHVDDIDTPKRVDELMAQIPDTPQDGTYPHGPRRREINNGRPNTTTHFTVHETEPLLEGQTKVTLDAKSGAVVPHTPTKPVSGLPVYYPPGSTEFKPKPESEMMFQSYESSGGGGKYRSKSKSGWKASGKSSSKSGSRESHAEGGAVIPICLPLCCGAACSVM